MGAEGLRVSKLAGRGGTRLKLGGAIDELLDGRVFEGLDGVVVLDLEGITRITSFGVLRWVDALKQLKADSYWFVRCKPNMVAQFNMVSGFAGAGTLVTFFAPFQCTQCNRDFDVLVDLRTEHAAIAALREPEAKCPDCGAAAQFDDLAESYFSYAAAQPPPQIDAAAAALLDGGGALPFKVKKTIEGTVTVLRVSGTVEKAAGFKRIGDGLEGTIVVDLSGVLGVTAQGAAGFAAFASIPNVNMYVKGVPLAVVRELAAIPGCFARARIASVGIAGRCSGCGNEQTVELGAAALSRVIAGEASSHVCADCDAPIELATSRDALRDLEALRMVTDAAELDAIDGVRRAHARTLGTAAIDDERFGKYRLVKRIGAGGMAEVSLARQIGPRGFERNVVLKRILPHRSKDREFVDMFLQEARLAARLSHPNIVQIFELGHENGQYYMALEYVRGWDLHVILRAAQKVKLPMPVLVACRLVSGVCAGLYAAHSYRDDDDVAVAIVHRDVTPHNVLVSKHGIVKLSDFGIAKVVSVVSETEPGTLKGKLPYIAPELLHEEHTVDARADIYSAGLVLYECLTFGKPFKRDDEAATLQAVLAAEIPPLAASRPDAPRELQGVIDRATARDREKRYATAEDMQLALEQIVSASGQTVTATDLASWLSLLVDHVSDVEPDSSVEPLSLTPTGRGSATHSATRREKI